MKFIAGVLLGLSISAAIAWAGSYSITLTTNADTDNILPQWVARYNERNGTSYTVTQYAEKLCSDAVAKRTDQIIRAMGR